MIEGYFKDALGGDVDNTLFHLSNRFFREMVDIGVILGGKEITFNGLSGLTDFMLSCFGADSHDRKFGNDLVNGITPQKVTSGSFGIKVISNLLRLDFEKYPIMTAAHEVVVNNADGEEMYDAERTALKITKVLPVFSNINRINFYMKNISDEGARY
jgi:glycerol-3-phosphate dehydrogenase